MVIFKENKQPQPIKEAISFIDFADLIVSKNYEVFKMGAVARSNLTKPMD